MITSLVNTKNKKPTLKTSYNSLHDYLWKCKQQSKIQAQSNLILKTTFLKLQKNENRIINKTANNRRALTVKQKQNNELQQLQNRCLESYMGSQIVEQKIVEKQKTRYSQLINSIKNQENWIKRTKLQIEEKNYDKMKQKTKTLQNLVNKYSKKLQKIQRSHYRKERKYEKVNSKGNANPDQQIQQIKKVLIDLENVGEQKAIEIDKLDMEMKKISQDILQLLNVKNQLKKLGK